MHIDRNVLLHFKAIDDLGLDSEEGKEKFVDVPKWSTGYNIKSVIILQNLINSRNWQRI